MSHNENCQECKEVFLTALEKQFGKVSQEWSSGWPCRIDEILDLPLPHKTKQSLHKIYKALQDYRGYKDFVGVRKLPRSDYYIKSLNCIVEFDESQHFTAPRALTLSLYPRGVKLGYDKKDWLAKCRNINRHDNTPICRDETRAWYDALRDLLPIHFGMSPTVRLFSKQLVWCKSYIDTESVIKNRIGKDKNMNDKEIMIKSESIDFRKINRDHVFKAIDKIDKEGVPKDRIAKSTKLDSKSILDSKDDFYPVKYVLETAYEIATNKKISPDDHTGGDTSAKILNNLGFKVIKNNDPWRNSLKKKKTKVVRVFLKGKYDSRETRGEEFNNWVIDHGEVTEKRIDECLDLIKKKNSIKNSIIVFPACTIVIRSRKMKEKWNSYFKDASENTTIIMGVIDKSKSKNWKEYSAIWHNGNTCLRLDPKYPERKLPVGDGWVFISSNIDMLRDDKNQYLDPGNYCLDLGHGGYADHHWKRLLNISKEKKTDTILVSWYKSGISNPWIYKNGKRKGKELEPKYYTESYKDLVNIFEWKL
jgi:hypothetical protein